MQRIRTLLTSLAVLAAVCMAGTVHAQSRDRAAAEALFRAGREAADAGDHALACARFAESERLDPQIGTQFNLGDCNERLGKTATAWQLFSEVLQKLPPGDERVPIARERVAHLESRLPRLTLRVDSDAPPGTRVIQDEVELRRASFGIALPVDPGEHTIRVVAPGHVDREYTVTVTEGKQQELLVSIGEALPEPGAVEPPAKEPTTEPAPVAVAPPPEPAKDRSGRRTAGVVVGGVGLVGLGVSMGTGAMAIAKKRDMLDGCSPEGCTDDGLQAADDGKTIAGISTASFVVGAVAVGVGTYLIVSSRKRPARAARFGLRSTPGGAALVWGGTL